MKNKKEEGEDYDRHNMLKKLGLINWDLEVSGSEFLSSDSSSELDVSDHDGNSSGVDGAKVGVLEKSDQVGLDGFLQSVDGGALESEVLSDLSSDGSDDSLERKLSQKQVGALLVLSDFSDGDGSWSESVWLLDSSHGSL